MKRFGFTITLKIDRRIRRKSGEVVRAFDSLKGHSFFT